MADDRRNYHDIGSARTSSISQVGATILIHEAAVHVGDITNRLSPVLGAVGDPPEDPAERDSRALTVLVGMSAEPDVAALLPHMAGQLATNRSLSTVRASSPRHVPTRLPKSRRKLPHAPRRRECYQYFRRQERRLLTILLMLLSSGSLYGIWAVFSKSLVWLPSC